MKHQIITKKPNSVKHMRITSNSISLYVEEGYYHRGTFLCAKNETLFYAEHPELMDLCKAGAWDIEALHDFIVNPDEQEVIQDAS